METKHLIHKHSNASEDYLSSTEVNLVAVPKKPTVDDILDGEIAVNNKKGCESLFIKNSEGEIINLLDINRPFVWYTDWSDDEKFINNEENPIYTFMWIIHYYLLSMIEVGRKQSKYSIMDIIDNSKESFNFDLNAELKKFCESYTMDFWNNLMKYSVNHTDLIIKSGLMNNPAIKIKLQNKNFGNSNYPLMKYNHVFTLRNWRCQIYPQLNMSEDSFILQFLLEPNYDLRNPSIFPQYFNKIPFYIRFNVEPIIKVPIEDAPYETFKLKKIDRALFTIGSNSSLTSEVLGYYNNFDLMSHLQFNIQKLPNTFDKNTTAISHYQICVDDTDENDLKIKIKKD